MINNRIEIPQRAIQIGPGRWFNIFLPGKSHGRRSLVGYSPWGCKESDTTERLHFNFSLSCIRDGNGNPLQCSCLENPREDGAWWAAICGVTQSRTWLKRLSSSGSSICSFESSFFHSTEWFWDLVILYVFVVSSFLLLSTISLYIHILPFICLFTCW